jgi:predicted Zn-ribbon and HTH transcriptional regulator
MEALRREGWLVSVSTVQRILDDHAPKPAQKTETTSMVAALKAKNKRLQSEPTALIRTNADLAKARKVASRCPRCSHLVGAKAKSAA